MILADEYLFRRDTPPASLPGVVWKALNDADGVDTYVASEYLLPIDGGYEVSEGTTYVNNDGCTSEELAAYRRQALNEADEVNLPLAFIAVLGGSVSVSIYY